MQSAAVAGESQLTACVAINDNVENQNRRINDWTVVRVSIHSRERVFAVNT